MQSLNNAFRCGYVAIVGRPNVGKSTLLNKLVGQKISITTRKPQTTRHRILGVKTATNYQAIYIDTPGAHEGVRKPLNRRMNRAALAALADVDVVIFMVADLKWTDDDQFMLRQLKKHTVPVILAVNKVDAVNDKTRLLPFIQDMQEKTHCDCIVPISARRGQGVVELEDEVIRHLPAGEPIFDEDQVTDRSMRFLAAEIIREKLMCRLGQELPYSIAVEIEKFTETSRRYEINALIWVERQGQKAIVVGKGGEILKDVGTKARLEMERLFDHKVVLHLWVKVKEGWTENERFLSELGIDQEAK